MRRSLSFLLVGGLAACGGSSGTTGGSGASSGSSSGGTSGTEASSTSSSSGGSAYVGTVILAQTVVSGHPLYTASALFETTPSAASCTPGASGTPCCYRALTASSSGGSYVSAGAITLSDDGTTLATLAYSTPGTTNPDGYTPLNSETTPALTWEPGDALQVSASGATVDSFSGSAAAPPAVVGISPTLSDSSATSVSVSSAFTVSWTANTSAASTVGVNVLLVDDNAGSITCTAPLSAGAVSVPPTLLANFKSGDTGTLDLNSYNVVSASSEPANGQVLLDFGAPGGQGLVSFTN